MNGFKNTVTSLIVFCALAPAYLMNQSNEPARSVWITVFVHGIKSIKPHLNPRNIINLWQDRVEDTLYAKTIEFMRADPFFEQNQAMQRLRLCKVTKSVKPGNGAALISDIFAKIDHSVNGTKNENYFYTYGWCGLLSHKARFKAAQILYTDLQDLVAVYKAQGITPHIRLIGYSHGGSVVLTTAQVKNEISPELFVDEIVLLGTPIEQALHNSLYTKRFGTIYNIYSPADRVQLVDIFGHGQIFTNRIFSGTHLCPLPNNLVQIELRVLKLAGETTDSTCTPLTKPLIYAGPCKSPLLRDVSPGHFELWFFGWTDIHYRPHFPLHPLPIVVFLPYIIAHAKAHPCTSNLLRMSIDPQRALMITKENSCSSRGTHYPFLSYKELQVLKQEVISQKPKDCTNECHYNCIKKAINKAKKWFK